MAGCKITVIKRSLNEELADKYISGPVEPCDNYKDGQEFIVSEGLEKPHGFCSWAWNDIYKTVVALSRGGNFNQGLFADWMKDDKSLITCCTDGIRPVIFKVERLEE
jgi:uncharacterized repeat protein (TIGR04076 family)